jgi:adenylate cyclase
MSHEADEAIPPYLIHDALQRVIGSQEFSTSDRKKRFLKYIVQEALARHADRIKAYTIAVDIFGRDPSFDPAYDPVVRIEAGRLRRCPEHYYLTEGSADQVQITIPKGGYVPQFTLRKATKRSVPKVLLEDERLNAGRMPAIIPVEAVLDQAPVAAPSSSPPLRASFQKRPRFLTRFFFLVAVLMIALLGTALLLQYRPPGNGRAAAEQGPTLMVLPFENDSGDPAQNIYAKGTTEAVIGALILFKNIFVLGADTSFRFPTEMALRDAVPRVDYVLKGSINRVESQIQINVALLRATDHQYLWSGSFRQEFSPGKMIDLQQDIATQVARIVVQPHGIIDKAELRDTAGRPP